MHCEPNRSSKNSLRLQPSHKLCYLNETIHSGKLPCYAKTGQRNQRKNLLLIFSNYFDYILGNRRQLILRNDVFCWSSSLHSFYVSHFVNLHPDMEVCKTDFHSCKNIITAKILQKFKFISLYVNFRFIKSDKNFMMLNICGSLVLSYAMFLSSVEQTANEVSFLITNSPFKT